MALYYISFGTGYAQTPHPKEPSIHPDGVCEIEADSEPDARDIAWAVFGAFWAMCYTQREMNKSWRYFPRGVTHRIIDGQVKEVASEQAP